MKNLKKKTALLNPVYLWIALIILIAIPTFVKMLQPGIYSMQDFPYFRLVEYSKCLVNEHLPCRWAPDAGLGFGEPVFNFYSHIPFLMGALVMQIGFGAITSLKFVFIFSLVASAISMFLFSREVWKNNISAFVSSMLYLYAPYRAVNVWVRGALPEAFAFIFLPLILLSFERYIKSRKIIWLFGYTLSLALLILTHNLSVLLFAHAIFSWILVRLALKKSIRLLFPLAIASILALCLSAFYLLPAVAESSLVNLQTTTQGYFDFRAHFVTLPQLFTSRFWGYGGSTWGDQDGLSLAIGPIQWISSLLVLLVSGIYFLRKKGKSENSIMAMHLVLVSFFYLFMTHNQSAFVWEAFSSVMKYIQFPWRFLGVTLFTMSFAAGYLFTFSMRYKYLLAALIVISVVLLNAPFFREDIWNQTTDTQMQTGDSWIEQSRASIGDYWPKYGPIPTASSSESFPSLQPTVKASAVQSYDLFVSMSQTVEFPVAYFPNWIAIEGKAHLSVSPSKNGLVSVKLEPGIHKISFLFVDTMIRTVGNVISSITAFLMVISILYMNRRRKLT